MSAMLMIDIAGLIGMLYQRFHVDAVTSDCY